MPAYTEKQRRFFAMCAHGGGSNCPRNMSRAEMREWGRKPLRKKKRTGRRGGRR